MPFPNMRLLNSHYQKYESHRNADPDIIMQDVEHEFSNQVDRKYIHNVIQKKQVQPNTYIILCTYTV
jgi:hypothetical protein